MRIKLQLLILLYTVVSFQLSAATVTWDGGAGTTNWMDAMNWDTDAIPTSADDVDLAGSTVILAANTTVQRVYAGGSSHLTINTGVTLTITGFAGNDEGLEVQGSATVINDGTIAISSILGGTKANGLYNKGTTVNNGAITINGIGQHGLYVVAGLFTNASTGTITVTNTGQVNGDGDGVYVDDANTGTLFGTLTNEGIITVTSTTGDDGVYVNDNTTLNNTGTIIVSGTGGDMGMRIDDGGVFNNNSGGTLTINATIDDQLFLDNDGAVNNTGTINLNNSPDIGLYLTDAGTFTNIATGQLNITDAADHSIQIDANSNGSPATFSNSGTVTITNGATDGLRMQEAGIFTNNIGGILNITGPTDDGIELDDPSVLNNSGTINMTATDHGMDIQGTFNNMNGGLYNATGCGDDGIRVVTGTVNNDGAISIDGSGSEDIEVDATGTFTNTANATFAPGASPGDLEIRNVFDLGTATVTFEINGPTPVTDFDQILNANGTGITSTLTVTNATIHLDWGAYVPEEMDKFMIIDGSGPVSGTFATITTSNSDIQVALNYTATSVEVEVTGVVPVEMTYFKGNSTAEGNLLQWETATEEINEGFEVQKSLDGENWEVIGFVEGNGTTIEVSNYEFLDENTQAVNYYRLKQMDFDGAFEYSKIIMITSDEVLDNKVSVYPNPVQEQLTVKGFNGILTVYNVLGQPVRAFQVVNEFENLSLDGLENGQYFIEMIANDGTKTVRQIVKTN